MNPIYRSAAAALAAAAVCALVVGWLMQPAWGWATITLALAALLFQHVRNLARLRRWLEHSEPG